MNIMFARAPFSRINAYSSLSLYGLFLTCGEKIKKWLGMYLYYFTTV
jgi:hypothetical protein